MKNYLVFVTCYGAGVGCDSVELIDVEAENVSELQDTLENNLPLQEVLWEMACANAESYGVYPLGDYEPEDGEEENYSEDIGACAVVFNPEKHSGEFCGSWEDEVRGEILVDAEGYYYVDNSPEARARKEHAKRLDSLRGVARILEKDLEVLEAKLRLVGDAIADKRTQLTKARCEVMKLENL